METIITNANHNVLFRLYGKVAFVCLLILTMHIAALAGLHADLVVVKKSESKLYLMKSGKVIKAYYIALGAHPKGHKQQQGDERTPEGRYILDYKTASSDFYKAIHISYPNVKDRKHARERGVNPGGAIMIHGQKNGLGWLAFLSQRFNWTDGCIAVTNKEMDEIWDAVRVGTPIEIKP